MSSSGTDHDDRLSLVAPVGYSASTCGYCPPPGSGLRSSTKSSKSYGIWSHFITPHAYQALLDRGWRRSGHYIYRPDNGEGRTCCPQVGIRVKVDDFQPRRQHRRAFTKLHRALTSAAPSQSHSNGSSTDPDQPTASTSRMTLMPESYRKRGKYSRPWEVEQEWNLVAEEQHQDILYPNVDAQDDPTTLRHSLSRYHANRAERAASLRREKGKSCKIEPPVVPRRRRLETRICLAQGSDEKYELFRKYQMQIHGESKDKVSSRKSFERFLCDAPLMSTMPGTSTLQRRYKAGDAVNVDDAEPVPYDLYHTEWRLDDRLVAVGVLDVLPESLSSVYLFYDPAYKDLELGKVSALREIVLVKQLQRKRHMQDLRYYNVGLYIHGVPKMRYKAQFGPAQLLDPSTCKWEYLDRVRDALDRGVRYDWASSSQRNGNCVPEAKTVSSTASISPTNHSTLMNTSASTADDDDEDEESCMPAPPPPGIAELQSISMDQVAMTCLFHEGKATRLIFVPKLMADAGVVTQVRECLAALGPLADLFCLVL